MTSRRRLGLGLLLAALVAVAAWLAGGAPRRADHLHGGDGAAGRTNPGAEVVSSPPAAALDARVEIRASAEANAPGPSIEPSLTHGIVVRVLRGTTDEPVADAVVAVADALDGDSAEGLESRTLGRTLGNVFLGPERRYRTGDDGRVRVPAPRRFGVATCATADGFGYVDLGHEPAGVELRLRVFRDPSLTVRVVDVAEKPVAHAEVAILWEDDWGDWGRMGSARTDADGIAELRHVSASAWFWDGGITSRLSVGLVGVFDPPVAVEFDPRALPLEVELEMPLCTAVDVELWGLDGERWREPALVEVGSPLGDGGPLDDRWAIAAFTRDGRARFERVGVDLPLAWNVSGPGVERWNRETRVEHRSASAPRGRVACALPVHAAFPPLRATLLLPGGAPCVEREVHAALGASWVRHRVARTDASGGLNLGDRRREDLGSIDLVVADGAGFLVAHASVADSSDAAQMNLGVLRLERATPAVGGRTVDERGAPVAGAKVRVRATVDAERFVDALTVTTGADGAFTAWLPGSSAGPILLDVRHRDHRALRDVAVAFGRSDVELVLTPAGAVESVVLLDHRWMAGPLGVEMEPTGAEGERASGHVDPTGDLRVDGLAPGTYELRIATGRTGPVLGSVDGVRVRAGETVRLPPIDLHGRVYPFRLDVTDAREEPLNGATVLLRAEDGGWVGDESAWAGIVAFLAPAPVVDVAVLHGDWRCATFEGVRSGERLVLRRPRLRVQGSIVGLPERFAAEDLELVAELVWTEPGAPSSSIEVPATTAFAAELPGSGAYALRLTAGRRDVTGAWRPEASFELPFHVADVEEPQEVELEVPAALQEILAVSGEGIPSHR